MAADRPEIPKRELVSSLWKAYRRTDEYKLQGRTESISSVHPLVEAAERIGLTRLIRIFIRQLLTPGVNLRDKYQNRDRGDWIDEWKRMNAVLFKSVYKDSYRGKVRLKGQDVRFGSPGDEDLHGVPKGGGLTMNALYELADRISYLLKAVDAQDIESVCTFLAQVHYGFIRVHPFPDGNGRIARAVTDQLAICLGYPPIIAAFPRLDEVKKEKYHQAITGCIGDPTCTKLASWIKQRVEQRIVEIA